MAIKKRNWLLVIHQWKPHLYSSTDKIQRQRQTSLSSVKTERNSGSKKKGRQTVSQVRFIGGQTDQCLGKAFMKLNRLWNPFYFLEFDDVSRYWLHSKPKLDSGLKNPSLLTPVLQSISQNSKNLSQCSIPNNTTLPGTGTQSWSSSELKKSRQKQKGTGSGTGSQQTIVFKPWWMRKEPKKSV